MTHYSLDVDPESLRAAASQLRRAGGELAGQAAGVESTAAGWASGWIGDAATACAGESTGMAALLTRGSQALEAATGELERLADTYAEALDVHLPALERRREAATSAYAAAVSAAQSGAGADAGPGAGVARAFALAAAAAEQTAALQQLEAAYDQLVEDLRARTRAAGAQLAADPPVPVPVLARATYQLGGFAGGLLGRVLGHDLDAASALADLLPMGALVASLQDPPRDLDALTGLLDQARAAGLPPTQYGEALRRYWEGRALEAAGIDLAAWDPELGASANRATIEAVYAYYAELYLDDPDLQWAGMAAMIGPSFAGGFYDLALLRELADHVPDALRPALPPGFPELGDLTADEIAFYEETLLSMQQQIFLDMAPSHQAYADGGLAAIEELRAADQLSIEQLDAWRAIASGDPQEVAWGNELHLRREQWEIIKDDYDTMRGRFPSGPAVTWAVTFVGAPSIEGARSYPDVFPETVTLDSPGPRRVPLVGWDNPLQVRAEVETPFPEGNISVDHQRWELISRDTLPAFQEQLEHHPDQVEDELRRPVDERIEEWRLAARWDEIVAQLGDWDVRVRQ